MIYVSCDWIIEDTYMIISTFTCLFIPSSVGFIKLSALIFGTLLLTIVLSF